MKNIILSLLCLFCLETSAQAVQGVVTYNRKTDWISIMSKLPYVSQEEVDRYTLSWGNEENKGENFELHFKNNKSIYQPKEEDTNDYGYSWKKRELILIRDHKDKKLKELREEIGTKFLVEEDLPKTKWKILNEIKEIEGYLCMKAETKNEMKGQTIHAWFTDAIPISAGPEGYNGLPGIILELNINNDDAIITATKVDLETAVEKLPVPKKMKGKKTTLEQLNARIEKFIAQSIEGQKNPFWRVRY